ncbi:MAG: HprK-related kinase A [Gammaproteobacteria bacterium]
MVSERLRDFPVPELQRRLDRGLRLREGPFVVEFKGADRFFAETLNRHYPNYRLAEPGSFADARLSVGLNPTPTRRRWNTRVIRGETGEIATHCPKGALLAHLEWTLNWAIAHRAHQYLMLHAGVLADARGALILPAHPGSGKSTLCAYLMHHGWRLLSDEFTLIRDDDLAVHPFPRLVPLKNQSIDVIRSLVPAARLGPLIPGTHKGTISHLCPDDTHLDAMETTAPPRLMIFPKYRAGAELTIAPVDKPETFVEISQNSFNYVLLGEIGFRRAVALTNRITAYRLTYSDLPTAAHAIDDLMSAASG